MKTTTFFRSMALMAGLVFYSLSGWGQGFETFENLGITGTAYQSGTFIGQDGSTWTFWQSRGDYEITGKAIMLGRNRTPQSEVYSGTINGGIGELNFDYSQAFGTNVNLNVLINEEVVGNVTSSGQQGIVLNSGIISVNQSGPFVIKFINVNNSDGQVVIDNVEWTGFGGGNFPPVITNIIQTPDQDITSSTTLSVSADVTDSDGAVELVELRWGTATGVYTNTIPMSLDAGDNYITDADIPAQSDGTTVYYVIYAEDDQADSSTSPEQSYEVSDPAITTLPYEESFDADLGDSYVYNVSGATKFWNWNSGSAQMNGFDSGDTEEDWLILPGFNPDNYEDEVMTFESWYRFGIDDANNYLKLFYSTDYDGIGNPTSATWTELSFTQPAAEQVWTLSGNIDLSGITGTEVWIAFKYRYEPGSYRWWQIDNIMIQEVAVEDPDSFFASAISPSEIGLAFATNMDGDDVVIAFNDTGVFSEPAGTPPAAGQPFAGGTLLYSGTMSPLSHTGLDPEETVYYKAWSFDGSTYSPGLSASAITYALEPSNHVTGLSATANSASSITVTWTDSDASGYLIKGSAVDFNDIIAPVDGIAEADGALIKNVAAGVESHQFNGLNASTEYFFEIYPYNGTGATINYKVDEPVPQASATTDAPPAGYLVDFEGEGETKPGYAQDTVVLSGLEWDMTEALIGTSTSDWKNGERSARMRGYGSSSMTMLENKSGGIGEVIFLYRRYGGDSQVDWKVEYSTDNGDTWTQIGDDFTAPATDDVQVFSEVVNIAGDARIRIKRATEEGTSNSRLNIDDILITDFDGGVPENRTVDGITLGVDDTECYDATNNITVTNTTIGNGASVEFRAGVNIIFGDGFIAQEGSYMLATITDVYCTLPPAMLASEEIIVPEIQNAINELETTFKVYPNPNSGMFALELSGVEETAKVTVEIYSMMGERLLQSDLSGSQVYQFDLSAMPKGVYILRIMNGGQAEIQRIIKQ
jgi:hypothetical protein